ncbi:centromere protein X isoform X1 [Talpa occidentalis]|uniref:centromere protein X isoform X1 n=1 Tax=Talpa occidentalis TaxID=50954 RepID=UPI00189058E2|nr:centromere protein X isoform X1 [Talpa occidentalis]
MEVAGAGFRKDLVSKLLCLHFKDDKTRVSGDALRLSAELLKIFVRRPCAVSGRPRRRTWPEWTWTTWRRCCRSCSWTSRCPAGKEPRSRRWSPMASPPRHASQQPEGLWRAAGSGTGRPRPQQ